MTYILALDQGTSSSRSILFGAGGETIAVAQREFRQQFPQPGWVEHDPLEIWESQLTTARAVLAQAGVGAKQLAGLGITNQRETTLVWERATGAPLHNAIVWQDRRSEPICERLRRHGLSKMIPRKTGLVIDPYFSATKLIWLLENVAGMRERAARGELAFGTIDTWLAWKLSGGRLHITDVSNASRTMLWNIHEARWDDELLELLGIPAALLPTVSPSSLVYGEADAQWLGAPVPIAGLAGDQQSALVGQACLRPGMAKNTYGTGCFMLLTTGTECPVSSHGLITTVACQTGTALEYAFEGSVFIGGAVVQWLRDGLKAIETSADIEALAASVPDSGGVVFVPAFTGLGAPYWDANARGAIVGLTRGTTVAHVARAALESIAFQSAALLEAMQRDAAAPVSELRVDGGAATNNLLLQFQADLLGIPVVRPSNVETTALGAAYLAGLATGVFKDRATLENLWRAERTFVPTKSRDQARDTMTQWEQAVARVRSPNP